jgi:predicted CoA-binding protein
MFSNLRKTHLHLQRFVSKLQMSTDTAAGDAFISKILRETKLVAMVGASPTEDRPSYKVMKFLQSKGFRILPVNPAVAGKGESILGETAYATLSDIPEDLRSTIDMVDIFRKPADVSAIVDEAIAIGGGIKTIWMQLGIEDPESAARAEVVGMKVVMDRCPKIEHQRLIIDTISDAHVMTLH